MTNVFWTLSKVHNFKKTLGQGLTNFYYKKTDCFFIVTERHRNQPERAPTGQNWSYLNNKISTILSFNPNSEINICEHVLTLSNAIYR